MEAVFYVTHLGKQAIILGLPWLEWEDDISWKKRTLKWKPEETRVITAEEDSFYDPTFNLAISFIKGEATEETQQQWNESRINKAMLFQYNQDKARLDEMATKTLEEKVPVEFHKYLKVFSDEEASHMPKRTIYNHKIELKEEFMPK